MLKWILFVLAVYFAAVGLVQVLLALSRGFMGGGRLEQGFLLLPIRGDDPGMEMKIRQTHAELAGNSRLEGVRLVVVNCGAGAETLSVCTRLCADKYLPLLEADEVPDLLQKMP